MDQRIWDPKVTVVRESGDASCLFLATEALTNDKVMALSQIEHRLIAAADGMPPFT